MATFRAGPAYLFAGDPNSEETFFNLGEMETTSFDPGIKSTGITTALSGDAMDSEGLYTMPPAPQIQGELFDQALTNLANIMVGLSVHDGSNGVLGLGGAIRKLDASEVKTVAMIPVDEYEAYVAAVADGDGATQVPLPPNGIWLPAYTVSLNGFENGRITEGSNPAKPFSVTFAGARRKQDQASNPIATDMQWGFIGDPTKATPALPWVLPTS